MAEGLRAGLGATLPGLTTPALLSGWVTLGKVLTLCARFPHLSGGMTHGPPVCVRCVHSHELWLPVSPPSSFMSLPPPPQVTFKKTKRKVKKIRKKEKETVVRADDLLPLGDQTQDGDFGSRCAGRGGHKGGLTGG